MDKIIATLYYDAIHRYLKYSDEYQAAQQALADSQGSTWLKISDAAEALADCKAYLSFLLGFRFGLGLEQELSPLWEGEF